MIFFFQFKNSYKEIYFKKKGKKEKIREKFGCSYSIFIGKNKLG